MSEYGELEVIIDTCNLNVNIVTSTELDCHAVVRFSDTSHSDTVQCGDNNN
ncbi:MAG: hypothetical protein IJ778_04250 [Alphaproteobacteria bacterium]|nr:hypothetical protein [Alphaproteobacteria bacterium]